MRERKDDSSKTGQRLGLFIAGIGVFYVIATLIGDEYGWSNRTMALIGLVALAGFGVALWKAIGLWRARKE